jgi:hypothetical protein
MTREICFIDLETGCGATCSMEVQGKDIDCSKCEFKKQYEDKEQELFSYTMWTGELSVAKKQSVSQVQPKGVTLSTCGVDNKEETKQK